MGMMNGDTTATVDDATADDNRMILTSEQVDADDLGRWSRQ